MDLELTRFAQSLVVDVAVPELIAGYDELVTGLRAAPGLPELVAAYGALGVLSTDAAELSAFRKTNRELVTDAEKIAESRMRDRIASAYPTHGVVGEEHGVSNADAEWRWVIDPVDGTASLMYSAIVAAAGGATATSYALGADVSCRHEPQFGVTLGLVRGDQAVAGVVAELLPVDGGGLALGRVWVGGTGQPTVCDGIEVSAAGGASSLADARLACTAPESMFPTRRRWGRFVALAAAVGGSCVTGANCVGFMRTLADLDVTYEADLAYHDAAVLIPILAGGGVVVSDESGAPLEFGPDRVAGEYRVLAARPAIHAAAVLAVASSVPVDPPTDGLGARGGSITKFPVADF